MDQNFILPQWNAPTSIKAFTTTRVGGFSSAPFDSFNLGAHVGDRPKDLNQNRQRLNQFLPSPPTWLEQTHSALAVELNDTCPSDLNYDACYSQQTNRVCTIMTADCLPILLTDINASFVAAIHAGWQGLANQIITTTINKLTRRYQVNHNNMLAWLGPAIGPERFEVGTEVKQAILLDGADEQQLFKPHPLHHNKWLANIYAIASKELKQLGISQISGGLWCTYSEQQRFFSYRRDGQCGRMASCIWISD